MKNYLNLIKFSHTIFALPFAFTGLFLGFLSPNYIFDSKILILVVLCMVFARTSAMGFNRYLDRKIDALNPRTAIREIPSGVLSANSVLIFVIVNCVLFILTTYYINSLCFYLSPIALLIILGYSYTKRFTYLCHFVLGLGLALAPIGAYMAVTGSISILPIIISLVVLLWVSGFDIIYALQDEVFDKNHNLYSIPVKLGRVRSLLLARVLHLNTAMLVFYFSYLLITTHIVLVWVYFIGMVLFIAALIYQHTIVKANDLSKVNIAFFTTNGLASLVFGICTVLSIL